MSPTWAVPSQHLLGVRMGWGLLGAEGRCEHILWTGIQQGRVPPCPGALLSRAQPLVVLGLGSSGWVRSCLKEQQDLLLHGKKQC